MDKSHTQLKSLLSGISVRSEQGVLILSPSDSPPLRRILYVNSYGGKSTWDKIKNGTTSSQHLWGCVQLANLGYEIALAEPLKHFDFRRPLLHDLPLLHWARSWLGANDILFCGHTLLYWTPLLARLGALRAKIVSLTYAREQLDFAKLHSAIIALTPAAADQAKKIAPKVRVAHLGWGTDVHNVPRIDYQPNWFLSCGITQRDHKTLCAAAARTSAPIRVVSPNLPPDLHWPKNTTLVTGGRHDDTIEHKDLLSNYYANCAASLIILKDDPTQKTAVGFTNLIEAMAMARPVIVTRTGALHSEIDVEKAGCGLNVPPGDSEKLAAAINLLKADRKLAEEMGIAGRRLAERHYNMNRFSYDLHALFETL